MNQNLNWVFLLAFLMIGSSGCYFGDDDDGGFLRCERGDGDTVTEEFDLSNFDGIQLTTDAEVFLTQGSEQRVTVEGPENLVDLLELDVQGDTWEIEFDRCVRDADEVKIFITIPEIRLIQVSGSGKVFGENRFNGENLDLRISGSGDMDLALPWSPPGLETNKKLPYFASITLEKHYLASSASSASSSSSSSSTSSSLSVLVL